MSLEKIIHRKVLDIRGDKPKYRGDLINARYILFDDFETLISLEEQDYYSYHDCSGSARELKVIVNAKMWKLIVENLKEYPKADSDY